MPPLRAAARENAIGRLQAGQRQADVAHALNVSQSTISRLWNRFRQSGSTADAPRSGRPRVTTPAQDRFIRLRHLRNRFLSAQSTVQALPGNQRISRQTVRNRIHGAGLRAYRPYQGNVLTRRHRLARMLWANQHQAWTLRNHWRHVWFSDESRFLLQRHDGRRRVYRRRGERYAAPCMDEAPPHGGGGVTVWGAISNTGRSQLVRVQGNLTAAQYIQDILQPHVLPLMGTPGAVLQKDNARPHTARITVARSISLWPRLFVPTSLYAQKSGILCPRLFVPKKVVFCAHVSLCPKKWYFVPTSLCAHVSLCPHLYMPKPMPVGVMGRFLKQTSGQAMAKLTSGQAMVKLTSGQAMAKLTNVKQWPICDALISVHV